GALLEAQAVRLADHRVPADSAKLVGDLAGGGAIVPHLLQALDALFGPGHILLLKLQTCPAGPQPIGAFHVNDQTSNWVRFAPGKPVLKGVNWGGLKTLYIKEVRRFFKV